eukprot:TRINITY_DN1260_c0_g3_i2.p1 TRINITY_DN1260_c0_g3~~TRINITY_DN1260_c0_g3_i2.p1  ORF type:complete len:908 (-),score=221.89 TRINITY_DN1260_c0_g3_i2:500-3223(-)
MSKQITNKKKVKIPGTQEEKIKYVSDVTLWPQEEVRLVLEETNWDVELAINNIADGIAGTKEWTVVQQKAKPKPAAPKEGGKKGEGAKETSNREPGNKKHKDDSFPRRSESEGGRGKGRAHPQRAQEGPQQNQSNPTQTAQENGTQTHATSDQKQDNNQINRQSNRGGGRGGRPFQNQYLPHSASKPKAQYGYQHPPGRGRPYGPQRFHTQPHSEQDKGNNQQALLQQQTGGFRPNQQFNANPNHKPPRPPHFLAEGNNSAGPEKDVGTSVNLSTQGEGKKESTSTAPVSQPHNAAQALLQAPHPSGAGAVSTQTPLNNQGPSHTASNSSTTQTAPATSATQQQHSGQSQQATGNFHKTNQTGKPGSQWKAKDVQGHWKPKDNANSQAPRQANPQNMQPQPQPQTQQTQHQQQPQQSQSQPPQPSQPQPHVSHAPTSQPQVKSEEITHKNEGPQSVEQPRPSQVSNQTPTQAQQHSTQIPSVNSEQSVNVNQSFSRYFNRTPVSLPVGIDVPSFKFQFGNSETASEESNPIGRFEQSNQVDPQFQTIQTPAQTQTKTPEATAAQNQHNVNQASQANVQNPVGNVLQLGATQPHSQEAQSEDTHDNSIPPFQQYGGFLPGHYVIPPLQHYGYDPEKGTTDLGRIPPNRPYYDMLPFPASYSSTSPNPKFPLSTNLNNNQNRNEKYNNTENAASQNNQQVPPSTSPTAQSQQHAAYPASLAAQYTAPLYHGYPYLAYSQGYPSASGGYSIPGYPRIGMYKPLPNNYPNYPHPSYPTSGYPDELSLDYYHGVPPQHPISYYLDPTVSAAASKNQQNTQLNNGNSSKSAYSSPPSASSSNHSVENYKNQDYKSTYGSGRESAQVNPYNYASPYGQPYPYAQTTHVLPGQSQSGTQASQPNNYQPNRNQNYS